MAIGYQDFDRKLNHSGTALMDGEPVLIGMDFNAGVVYVLRDGWLLNCWH